MTHTCTLQVHPAKDCTHLNVVPHTKASGILWLLFAQPVRLARYSQLGLLLQEAAHCTLLVFQDASHLSVKVACSDSNRILFIRSVF